MSGFGRKNPLAVLGLPNSASINDVKRKFRKLAQQHHPDRATGDKEQFQQILEAYESLVPSASQDREAEAEADYEEKQLVVPVNKRQVDNLLRFAQSPFLYSHSEEQPPIIPVVELSLQDLFQKQPKVTSVISKGPCECRRVEECRNCGGAGLVTHSSGRQSVGRTVVAMTITRCPCAVCKGTGKLLSVIPSCSKCCGEGICDKKVEYEIMPNPSLRDGNLVVLSNSPRVMGVVRLKPDPIFSVGDGGQLICRIPLSLRESLLGCTKYVTHPSGQTMEFTLPELNGPIPQPVMMENQGLWQDATGDTRGNILAEFYVQYPSKLTPSLKQALDNLLD